MSGYLINTVTIENNKAPQKVYAGTLLTDSSVIAAVQAAGGVIGSASDPVLVAQAAIVAKMRSTRAQNEDTLNTLMASAYLASVQGQAVVHMQVDLPLASLQALTSGTPFNLGAALPANARLLRSELTVVTALAGGAITAVTAQVQGGSDAAGTILGGAGSDVHGAAAGTVDTDIKTGSNPYVARGGQQLKGTITATGAALSVLTAGHLTLDFYYSVLS